MAQIQGPVTQPSQEHTRVNDTLLGHTEKKALLWLAARMPAWVVPDTLTALGFAASVLIFFSYALTSFSNTFLWLASRAFVLQWFGDSMDGTLARYRKIERPRYGFFVDHIIDTVSEALIFLGLGFSPYLRFDLALVALVSYLLLATYVYLATYVNGVFRISYARLGPTEARMLAIIANTIVFVIGNPQVRLAVAGTRLALSFYDFVVAGFTAIIFTMFVISAVTTAMNLSREDREAAARARRARRAARLKTGQAPARFRISLRTVKGDKAQAAPSRVKIDD